MASGLLCRRSARLVSSTRNVMYFPGLETRPPVDSATSSENKDEAAAKPAPPAQPMTWRPTKKFANVFPGTRAVNYFPSMPKAEGEKEEEPEPEEGTHDAYAHQPDVMQHSIAGPRSDYFPTTVHVPEGGRRFSLPDVPDVYRHSLVEPMGRNSMMDPHDERHRRQGIRRSSIQDSML